MIGDLRGTVPVADTADNITSTDVIGQKTDTNAGDSLYSANLVPAADAAANVEASDVIGNKTDTEAGDSLYANQLVPLADVADNVVGGDVIGNKTDTEAGDSLYANLLVPLADAAGDVTVSDAIGAKADTVAGTSLIALVRQELAAMVILTARQLGGVVTTWPVLSAGVQATAGAANVYGADITLAATVGNDSRLASICIRTPVGAMTGKANIGYDDGGDTFICEVDFEIATDAGGFFQASLVGMGTVIPAGADLIAELKTTAGADTAFISVGIMDA